MTAGRPSAADSADSKLPSLLVAIDFLTGSCIDFAELTFQPIAGRFRLTVSVVSTALHGGGGCAFLIGYGRSVTLELWRPIAPDMIEIERLPRT